MSNKFDFGLLASNALISDDGNYRYWLHRRWSEEGKIITFLCLNPSTADHKSDDQTIRKCTRFAKKWGGSQLAVVNLFAFRSTDPANLRSAVDPIGLENDIWLEKIIDSSDIIVAAWGTHGCYLNRNEQILNKYNGKLHALRLTKDGHPSHPLYLPENLEPFVL